VDRVIIVGGGLAGYEAARALRQQEFGGEIIMLAAEDEPPYDRPPLSKDLLLGREPHVHFDLSAVSEVDLRLRQPARALSPGQVETDTETMAADAIVLAVGADPIPLPGAVTLRTHKDAQSLHEQLYPGAVVAVIGAGWIGAEVASAAAEAGCIVTVYEAMSSPLATALPEEFGMLTAKWYEKAGVTLELGQRVDNIGALGADVVVAGLGARPATQWLSQSPIDRQSSDGAVIVDEFMRTSMEGVVAVGDCAAWWSRRYDKRMRVEHWDTALHAPKVAVSSALGKADETYDPVPYFWSDQFGHNLQCAGHRGEGDELIMRGEPGEAGWVVGWFRKVDGADRMTAILTVDHPRDLTQARRLMTADAAIDTEKFKDPDVTVKACAIS